MNFMYGGGGRGSPTLTKKAGDPAYDIHPFGKEEGESDGRWGEKEVTSTPSHKGSRYDNQTSFDDPNRWNARYSSHSRPRPSLFTEPFTEILGGSDVFIDQHSTINLTCIVHTPDKPAHVFWLRNGKVRLLYPTMLLT